MAHDELKTMMVLGNLLKNSTTTQLSTHELNRSRRLIKAAKENPRTGPTNAEFARTNLQFKEAVCNAQERQANKFYLLDPKGIITPDKVLQPTKRQASKFRRGFGLAWEMREEISK